MKSRPTTIKLKPGEKLGKPTAKDKQMMDAITLVSCGNDMHFNLKHYKLLVDHTGWACLTRKQRKTK